MKIHCLQIHGIKAQKIPREFNQFNVCVVVKNFWKKKKKTGQENKSK